MTCRTVEDDIMQGRRYNSSFMDPYNQVFMHELTMTLDCAMTN